MHSEKPLYFSREGRPITHDEVIRLFENPELRSVVRDQVGGIVLSTVHLVIDHDFLHCGRPIIFQSCIVGGSHDGRKRRYATETEARQGHADLLAELRLGEGVTLEEIELELAGLLP